MELAALERLKNSHRLIKNNGENLVSTLAPSLCPNFKKVGDILVSACVYSCSRYRLETSCMDSSWKNSRGIFLVFPELSPLVKLRPFDKQGDEIL